ncbi:MAG: hypothetical protein E7342_00165 [Clostridiales bacterium]|nr:hypothetical protein [Clostridiales bacterium]
MLKVSGKKEFIEKIKSFDDNFNVKLHSVEINEKDLSVKYNFITDKTVNDELKGKILAYCDNITDKTFSSVSVAIKKIVGDSELVINAIDSFIKTNYPSVSVWFEKKDVSLVKVGNRINFTISLDRSNKEYFDKNNLLVEVKNYLQKNFCEEFSGIIVQKEIERKIEIKEEVVERPVAIKKRTITVEELEVIDDENKDTLAVYIEDAMDEGEVCLCGRITKIFEKMTKGSPAREENGRTIKEKQPKPFFIIEFEDGTGRTSGVYFSKEKTLDRIRELKEGDAILTKGVISAYNGKVGYTINKINGCKMPENFVYEKKEHIPAPLNYSKIFPKKAETLIVSDMFTSKETPKDLVGKEYVVFDIETTGTDYMADRITEIGAVKIKDGVITEEFSTLINPMQPIPPNIVELTGITAEMVKDAPKFNEIFLDFYKFIEGSILVAHNADFDTKFVKYNAKLLNYTIDNEVQDTLLIARDLVFGVSNYKLNTLAERFNIKFHHHRALSDAYATAELFIELMKLKKE